MARRHYPLPAVTSDKLKDVLIVCIFQLLFRNLMFHRSYPGRMIKKELYEIPYRFELCYQKNKGLILPEDVPYIGMGASYIATTVFRYLDINLYPEKAAEYFNYLVKKQNVNNGVLISQSGQSSETLWCADYFSSFTAIVNDEDSPLVKHQNCNKPVLLYSADEQGIPSKTYLNTLLVLYLGFGFDPREVIKVYKTRMAYFEQVGTELGELIKKNIRGWRKKKSVYVLGNGPNIATAKLAAMVLSEVLKSPVLSMSASQYDHGFKETSKNAMVISITHEGPEFTRTKELMKTIRKAGATVFEISDPLVNTIYSPLIYPLFFFFAAQYLSNSLKVKSIFEVGNKITRVKRHAEKDKK